LSIPSPMGKKIPFYLRLCLLIFLVITGNKAGAQTATTTVIYTGFQGCGGCTVCGADYWCFNSPGSYCGNTGPCGSKTFADPVPAGNIVTSVTLNYFSADCAGGSLSATLDGNAIPTVNEGNTGCLCSNNPCAQSAASSQNFPCGLPGYVNGGMNTLQLCTGTSVCVNRIVLVLTYAPANQATPATMPATPSGPNIVCGGQSYTYSVPPVNANTYTWTVPAGWVINSGQGTTSITATPGGAGNVCVVASNLCGPSGPSCLPVTISAPSVPPASASATPNPICPGTPSSLSVIGGALGTGGVWKWYSGSCGGTLVGTGSPLSVSPASTTTYYVYAADACAVTSCASVVVTVSGTTPAPGLPIGPAAGCSGASQIFTTTGTPGATSYTWTAPAGYVIVSGQGTSSVTISLGPASGNICVKAIGPCGTSPQSCKPVTVTPVPPVPASITGTSPVCPGSENYSIGNVAGATGYTWSVSGAGGSISSGQGTTAIIASWPVSGTGIVSVTANNGCGSSSVATYTVQVNPLPVISVSSAPPAVCAGSSALLTASGGVSYTWVGGTVPSTGATVNISPIVNTTYTVKGTNANGCVNTATINITVNSIPGMSNASTKQTICSGASSSSVTLTSGTPGATFAWTASGPSSLSGYSTSGTNTIPPQTITNGGNKTDTVVYLVTTSANGCSSVTPSKYLIIVNPIPTLSNGSSSQTICSGASTVPVGLSSWVAGTTFSWTATASPGATGFALSGTDSIPAQKITNGGSKPDTVFYAVTMTANGCKATTPSLYMVIINPVPVLGNSSHSQIICSGASTTLVVLNSTLSGTTYAWTATGPPSASGYANSGTNTIPIQTITNSGPIADTIVYAIILTANGCSSPVASDYFVIVMPVTPSPIAVLPAAYCQGDHLNPLTASGSGIKWYSDPGLTILLGTGNSYVPTVTGTTTYYVTETINGCRSGVATTVTITINPKPMGGFTANPSTGVAPLSVNFTAAGGPVSYSWVFGNGSNGTGNTSSSVYPLKGTYTVICTATENNCSDTSSMVIIVHEKFTLIIPNVFTPNEDGVNDLFIVTGTGLTDFSMDIFDRWGVKLFSSTRISDGWNGRTNGGGELPSGTYYYIIQLKESLDKENKTYQGYLLLNR
jgi:gliding motility-associated-like protein